MGEIRHKACLISACCQGYGDLNGLMSDFHYSKINTQSFSIDLLEQTWPAITNDILDCMSKIQEDIVDLIQASENRNDI